MAAPNTDIPLVKPRTRKLSVKMLTANSRYAHRAALIGPPLMRIGAWPSPPPSASSQPRHISRAPRWQWGLDTPGAWVPRGIRTSWSRTVARHVLLVLSAAIHASRDSCHPFMSKRETTARRSCVACICISQTCLQRPFGLGNAGYRAELLAGGARRDTHASLRWPPRATSAHAS